MTDYRFQQFDYRIMLSDIRFSDKAKANTTIDLSQTVTVLDHGTTTLEKLAAGRLLVLVTGSVSCPMTISSLPELTRILAISHDAFSPVLVYVREAHPGEHWRQPESLDDKCALARQLARSQNLAWPIIVDDLEGGLHRQLDIKPNSLHVIDSQGLCLFQALWAGALDAIEPALARLATKNRLSKSSHEGMIKPFLRGAGFILPVLRQAGPRAERELKRGAWPVWLLAWSANRLTALPVARRGPAAGWALLGLAASIIGIAVGWKF